MELLHRTALHFPPIEDNPAYMPIHPRFQQITWRMPMKPMELFRRAVSEIGDVSAAESSAFTEKKHGVKIEPAFIRIFKATLQDLARTKKPFQDEKPIPPKYPSQAA